MTIDAVASDVTAARVQANPRPVYEGQPYYSFDDVVESFSFWDVVDIFNPLQHIPLVGTVYREITGDEIGGFARVAGGALFGGPIGAGAGIVGMAFAEAAGKDPGQLVFDAITGGDGGAPATSGPSGATLATNAPLGSNLLGMPADADPAMMARRPGPEAQAGTGSQMAAATTQTPTPASAPSGPLGSRLFSAPPGGTAAAGIAGLAGAGASAGLAGASPAGLDVAAAPAGAPATLDRAQSALLAAFVAQHQQAQPSPARSGDSAGRGSPTGAAMAPGGVDAAPRAGPTSGTAFGGGSGGAPSGGSDTAQNPSTSSGQENTGQDMNQHARRDPAPAAPGPARPGSSDDLPMPADIRSGREALRAQLMANRAAAAATGAASSSSSSAGATSGTDAALQAGASLTALASASRGGGMTGGTGSADGPQTDRPTGMTLADYRARPNRRGEDATQAARPGRTSGPAAPGTGAGISGMLPDAATMAGLLERGGSAAAAADAQARDLATGAGQRLSMDGRTFRALPMDGRPADQTNAPAADSPGGAIVTQPWFSQRVLDAMRKYDASRAEAGAS